MWATAGQVNTISRSSRILEFRPLVARARHLRTRARAKINCNNAFACVAHTLYALMCLAPCTLYVARLYATLFGLLSGVLTSVAPYLRCLHPPTSDPAMKPCGGRPCKRSRATRSATATNLYMEVQARQFCMIHSINAYWGRSILTGHHLIEYLNKIPPTLGIAYDRRSGNFSVAALNHWLQSHTTPQVYLAHVSTI
jgi:hypothetical protein